MGFQQGDNMSTVGNLGDNMFVILMSPYHFSTIEFTVHQ